MKKRIIILSIIILVCLLIWWYLLYLRSPKPGTAPDPTPSITPPIRSLTMYPGDFLTPRKTAPDEEIKPTDKTVQFSDLLHSLPIDTGDYTISFDYAADKFQVLIWNDAGEVEYKKLRSEKYPLLTDDQFDILDKRM